MVQAVIEAKDAWEVIEPLIPEVETPVGATDDGIAKSDGSTDCKAAPVDRAKDAKARIVIMGYSGQEASFRILHLKTAKEQWEELKRAYMPLGKQQLSTALKSFYIILKLS